MTSTTRVPASGSESRGADEQGGQRQWRGEEGGAGGDSIRDAVGQKRRSIEWKEEPSAKCTVG
jgi:hypothetical protein